MGILSIDILDLIKNKFTYPTWSTGSVYPLEATIINEDEILVFYRATLTIMTKTFKRIFPRYINLTPKFCWVLGFLKGEGMNSKHNKAYARFAFTNKNPDHFKICLEELTRSKFLIKNNLPSRCFQIHHLLIHLLMLFNIGLKD